MRAKSPLHRTERRAVFGALAAELGHELQGPLNLLRIARGRLAAGQTLDADELAALGEEIERLAEMNARLRTLAAAESRRELVSAAGLVAAAVAARDRPTLVIDVPAESQLRCDGVLVALALGELLDNAVEARRRLAGVRYRASAGFCVWDDGPGFEDATTALRWGTSGHRDAAGMGLTLVLRVARAHGYRLEVARRDELTEVWLLVTEDGGPR